jgi:hypothetical protein
MTKISLRHILIFTLFVICSLLAHAFSEVNKVDSKYIEFFSTSFNEFFEFKGIVKLSQEKLLIGYIRYLKTDEDGNIWIIDSKKCEIKSYFKSGNFRFVLGGRGVGPGEFMKPTDFFISKIQIYVTDPMQKRLHVFDKNNLKFKYFIKIRDGRTIHVREDEEIFLTGPLLINKKKGLKEIYHCIHIYNNKGDSLKSFFPINEKARINNFMCDGTYFCLDKNNNIYGIQEMEYKIYNYTIDGQLLKTFSIANNTHYIPPPQKPFDKLFLRSKAMEWINNWTHVIGIYISKDFLFVNLYNDNVKNYKYILDVYTTNGKFVKGGLESSYRLLHVDKQGIFYFLQEKIDIDSDITFSILKYGLRRQDKITLKK